MFVFVLLDDCIAGYYCEGGANVTAPSPSAEYPLNDVCPPGYYCPSGTKYWVACPEGTYRASTSKVSQGVYSRSLLFYFFYLVYSQTVQIHKCH